MRSARGAVPARCGGRSGRPLRQRLADRSCRIHPACEAGRLHRAWQVASAGVESDAAHRRLARGAAARTARLEVPYGQPGSAQQATGWPGRRSCRRARQSDGSTAWRALVTAVRPGGCRRDLRTFAQNVVPVPASATKRPARVPTARFQVGGLWRATDHAQTQGRAPGNPHLRGPAVPGGPRGAVATSVSATPRRAEGCKA